MSHGVLYMVWGDEARGLAARSVESLARHHPDWGVRVEVLEDPPGDPWEAILRKAEMFDRSPFQHTLFLDADTLVLGDLSFGFAAAHRHGGLAAVLCESPWLRRYRGLRTWGDVPEWNTGVIFFDRSAEPVFRRWRELAAGMDSSSLFFLDDSQQPQCQTANDQAAFGAACWELRRAPYSLPHNWNFRPQFHRHWAGPLKIWHDRRDMPAGIADAMRVYDDPGAVIRMYEFRPRG